MARGREGRPRIAICFFGITRSLRFTIDSIRTKVLTPARRAGETRVFAHLYPITEINNPRSSEATHLDPDEYRMLGADHIMLEEPGRCLDQWNFPRIAAHGDTWRDDFRSVRNLVHQLHSLREVTLAALDWQPDVVVFCRPDLHYFDSFSGALSRYARAGKPQCGIPYWQGWGGLNDRFAIVRGASAARLYGARIEHALGYCEVHSRPLHGELLLAWRLRTADVKPVWIRAARIRADGRVPPQEHFCPERILRLRHRLRNSKLPKLGKGIGVGILRFAQVTVDLLAYGSARDPLRAFPRH